MFFLKNLHALILFMLKYFLSWLPMLVLAVLNGTARDLWYKKPLGDPAAHQLSTVTLMILLGIYMWLVMAKFPPQSANHAIGIGLLWALLTLIFEFGLGLLRGNSLPVMLADYNVLKGRLWVLIPVWISLFPYIAWFLRKN